jgi:galactose mutarotase-like enzyme
MVDMKEDRRLAGFSRASNPLERVVLQNDFLHVAVLPGLGGKICSLRVFPEGEELLQQPIGPYSSRTAGMRFVDGDASGIDECLPSVSACQISIPGGTFAVPDHGDFWGIPSYFALVGNDLNISAPGCSLPLLFCRRIRLQESKLLLSYSVENISEDTVPYLWSAHPLFAVETGDRIVLPESVHEVSVGYSFQSRLGNQSSVHSWPLSTDANGRSIDLGATDYQGQQVADKVFTQSPAAGWAALERTRIRRRIVTRFDPEKSPYLGIWLTHDGWPADRMPRQHCIALEPCTAPVDSLALAIEKSLARSLPGHGRDEWEILLDVEPLS